MDTIQNIKNQLTNAWMSNPRIKAKYNLDENKSFEERFASYSFESILFYIVAYVIWIREKALSTWREEVDRTALATRYGTKEWWHRIALNWQDGDMTEVIDGAVGYSVIDASKRKISFCAVREDGRTLYLKVACGVAGAMFPLTAEELARFQSYLEDVKPLGIRVVAQSYPADSITIVANIYIDGERNRADVEQEVQQAIEEYLSKIVFGGDIYTIKMIDAIQKVRGVKDVHNLQVATSGSGWQTRKLTPNAGYVKIGGWGLGYYIE